jgi:DnaJ-class molecular chaperone
MFLRTLINRNHYEALGVGYRASSGQIKSAFRELAKKWHPDMNANDEQAEARFRRIKDAYECLSDKSRRNEYDREWIRAGRATWDHKSQTGENSDEVPDDGSLTRKQLLFLYSVAFMLPAIVSVSRKAEPSKEVSNQRDENLNYTPPIPEGSLGDKLVRAFYNPIKRKWERLRDNQEPPSPLECFKQFVRERPGAYSQSLQSVSRL